MQRTLAAAAKYGRRLLAGIVFAHHIARAFIEEYPSATTWLVYAMALGLVIMRFV